MIRRTGKKTGNLLHQAENAVVQKEVEKALMKPDFFPKGGKVGFHCEHFYTNNDAFTTHISSNPLSHEQIIKLKGRDLIFASTMVSFGLDIYLLPFLSFYGHEEFFEYELAKIPKKKPCPLEMDAKDVELFFPVSDEEKSKKRRGYGYSCYDDTYQCAADYWIGQGDLHDDDDHFQHDELNPNTQFFGGTSYSFNGYFGNEADEVNFYIKAALIVCIPAYSDKRVQTKG